MPSFKQMDLDAYTAAHRDEWDRLAQLGKQRRFTGDEADELIDRYQSGASAAVGDSQHGGRVGCRATGSRSTSRWRACASPEPRRTCSAELPEFFLRQIPAALYRIRWLTPRGRRGLDRDRAAVLRLGGQRSRACSTSMDLAGRSGRSTSNEDFVNYYSNYSEGSFSAPGLDQQRLDRRAVRRLRHPRRVRARTCMFSTPRARALGGAVPAGRQARPVLALHRAARPARAVLDLRGRRGRPRDLLGVDRARGANAASVARRRRAARSSPSPSDSRSRCCSRASSRASSPASRGRGRSRSASARVALAIFLAYQWILGGRAYRAGETGDLDEFEAGATKLVAG